MKAQDRLCGCNPKQRIEFMKKYFIKGGKVLLPEGIAENVDVILVDGKIAAFYAPDSDVPEDAEIVNAEGLYVSPGFVDVHQHGGGGSDYMDGTSDAFLNATVNHMKHGMTSVMPTSVSADTASIKRAIEIYKNAEADPRIPCNLLGLHLEGPYISRLQAGAQKPEHCRAFDPKEYEYLNEIAEGAIKRWSVAPEMEGVDRFAEFAQKNGITLSIAHTNASFEQVLHAYDIGFRHITHFYSCTSTVWREKGFRVAGVIEAAYYLDGMNVELIADGKHLPNSLLKLITKLKRFENISLCTDSMRAAGQDVTESFLGTAEDPTPVIIEDGVAKLPSREAFGGSIATTDRLIRTMMGVGVSLTDAVKMVTVNPLRMMNVGANKGELKIGYDADICIFDEGINVKQVFVGGRPML